MAKRGKNVLILTAAVLFGSLLATAGTPSKAIAADHGGPLVRTAEGPVQGFVNNGVNSFLGIPFAAAPVGALRWQPPQPHAAWTQTLDATKFGNTCPQITELGVFAGPVSVTEDCLVLNVFTPSHGPAANAKKLPVLVWIHGGGLFDGESNDYDASALVKGGPGGPTVVVTINYRLGLLGYFAHPAIDAEDHHIGNYGLMDQQAALQWVKGNIAAFGGDPGQCHSRWPVRRLDQHRRTGDFAGKRGAAASGDLRERPAAHRRADVARRIAGREFRDRRGLWH